MDTHVELLLKLLKSFILSLFFKNMNMFMNMFVGEIPVLWGDGVRLCHVFSKVGPKMLYTNTETGRLEVMK